MFVDAVLISYDFMTDFNGPARHFPAPFYPTGVYDADNPKYRFGPESTKYPNLTLPCNLYDERGNVIQNGYYMVVLSNDRKFLELYQSGKLKARVRVVKLVEKMYTDAELRKEDELLGNVIAAQEKKKLKKYRKAQEELTAYREEKAAESYADIEDSGQGYYILKYNYGAMKATGYIQK